MTYDAIQQALADAGLAIEDIDGIIVASNDQLDGRAIFGHSGIRLRGRCRSGHPVDAFRF
jgi:hypothetical protein